MRAPRLVTLLACVVGCTGAPATGGSEGAAAELAEADRDPAADAEGDVAVNPDVEGGGAPIGAAQPRFDATLAQARAQVRQGQLSLQARAQLSGSNNPDHRHAARLLQAIAGETPDPVLSRAGSRGPSAQPDPTWGEPESPVPAGEPSVPGHPASPDSGSEADLQAPALVPPPPTPVPVVLPKEGAPPPSEAAPTPSEGPESSPPQAPAPPDLADHFEVERSLLLRERPPREQAASLPRDAPRLVILTSLSLHASETGATLELAGAGTVELEVLPIDAYHLRLSIVGAGAVPGFLDASPSLPGIAVLGVERFERVIELEVEFGPGWSLAETASSSNGARAEFHYAPPGAPTPALELPEAEVSDLEMDPDEVEP